jgi:hypothetical protein
MYIYFIFSCKRSISGVNPISSVYLKTQLKELEEKKNKKSTELPVA